MSAIFRDSEAIADAILREVGPRVVLGLPLGLGKAIHIANALYVRAAADSSINLKIFTALTLEAPKASSELERRFLGPVNDRLFAGYPELIYAQDLRNGSVPPNIEVSEFFFLAGRWLSIPAAQQKYISANYTHAARYLVERGVNVIAQIVSKRTIDGEARYSLSCNTDMTLDLLRTRNATGTRFCLVGQVNSELPFMTGEGDLAASTFSHILDSPATDFPLFAPPKEPINLSEYATGLHVARLIPDGGTLQIGIGQEGDAMAQGLILRHHDNAAFRDALTRLSLSNENMSLHHEAPFQLGLHGLSEMLVDSFLALIDAGILTREIDGAVLHAAFFLGPRGFYRALREMSEHQRSRLRMTAVSFTNELYGDEEVKRRSRPKARFVNNAMMVTLQGAVVSDGLEDGRVVSGVGGQYNFVSQAFALNDARSVITLKSTRIAGGKMTSNIRWSYGHETIPRHLRDVIVTEYGIADLRGKSDRDVILAMLAVTDSRFQLELLRQAKGVGKVEKSFQLPATQRDNTPDRIRAALTPLSERGLLPRYPFGTDFTIAEQRLLPVLESLKEVSASPWHLIAFLLRGRYWSPLSHIDGLCLKHLGLMQPATLAEKFYQMLVRAALVQEAGERR
jgi:acyl-CoA hydrolase